MLFKHEPNYYLKTDIDRYFESKGIHVIYNGLMADELLMRSFVKDYRHMVDRSFQHTSKNCKYDIYQTMYPVVTRKKMTGFENVAVVDAIKRFELRKLITKTIFTPAKIQNYKEDIEIQTLSYKEALKNKVKKFKNPFVYLSGGADSEMLAYSLLDAGVKFKAVIFKIYNNNECINNEEIKYAFAFCKKENILPIVKDLDINNFWNSSHFKELAIKINQLSPQIVTHAHMVELMNHDYPDHTHLFGGEIRFGTRHVYYDDDENQNIIYLDKLPYIQANANVGLIYESVGGPATQINSCVIRMNTYDFQGDSKYQGVSTAPWGASPMTGTWYSSCSGSMASSTGGGSPYVTSKGGYSALGGGFSFLGACGLIDGNASGQNVYGDYSCNVYGSNSPGIVGGVSFSMRAVNN